MRQAHSHRFAVVLRIQESNDKRVARCLALTRSPFAAFAVTYFAVLAAIVSLRNLPLTLILMMTLYKAAVTWKAKDKIINVCALT